MAIFAISVYHTQCFSDILFINKELTNMVVPRRARASADGTTIQNLQTKGTTFSTFQARLLPQFSSPLSEM